MRRWSLWPLIRWWRRLPVETRRVVLAFLDGGLVRAIVLWLLLVVPPLDQFM
jgi:hypothetical protein